MAHGGGRSAIGKKPDAFVKAFGRAVRSFRHDLKGGIGPDTYTQRSQIRRGVAKPAAFRNTSKKAY